MKVQRRNAGFTLLELAVSTAILTAIAYTLSNAMIMAKGAHDAVMSAASENSARRASLELGEELKSANRDTVVIETLADGNHQLTFMLPIISGGNPDWGASDMRLSGDPELQSQAGWQVRYTVVVENLGGGKFDRQLWRQVLDDAGTVQLSDKVASGLRSGALLPRGFSVEEAGDVWEVTLTFDSETEGAPGRSASFHAATRN